VADLRAGGIDVVMVYKVDRLTRSLSDFAKLVELFDEHGVSFVSATQAFNTTTSMERLSLNVLLSFAQFEREVTGERIRNKIAASKRKGMWMGGTVPFGYHAENRKLLVEESEAETVLLIFTRSGCCSKTRGCHSLDAPATHIARLAFMRLRRELFNAIGANQPFANRWFVTPARRIGVS
jgi:DNA invertase Pin-like site-specific DNA recombinase